MLLTLFKKSLKSKLFLLLFAIFTLASGAFIAFPLVISLANGFTIQMLNNVMWTVMFCVFMVLLLIILLVLKSIIFDKDLDFLIKIELQYQVSKVKIYFYRFLVLLTYAYIYVTFCLICYFIYTAIFVQGKMKINIFWTRTVGCVAFLYIFALGTIAILFLTTFIKNAGFKFLLPFMVLLPFIAMTITSQFFLTPNINVSFQSFIAIEQDMIVYQKFQKSNLLSDYSDCFNNNILNQEVEKIFPASQLHNFKNYNIFFKETNYRGAPSQINYNKTNRTISEIYQNLINKTNNFSFKAFFTCLKKLFSNFEINNMFNLNFLQGGQNSIGFISKQGFDEMFYDRGTEKYNKSIDAFISEHFINLAQHYASAISEDQVKKFQKYYHDFTKQITLMTSLFFWEQPGYILAGNDYNLNNDLDRAAIYMTSTVIQRTINFNFINNPSGYVILSSKIERTYSYEFLVILYLTVIIIINYLAFVVFKRKIIT